LFKKSKWNQYPKTQAGRSGLAIGECPFFSQKKNLETIFQNKTVAVQSRQVSGAKHWQAGAVGVPELDAVGRKRFVGSVVSSSFEVH
jgi:hypothetical protein